jgi:aminopeptidase N
MKNYRPISKKAETKQVDLIRFDYLDDDEMFDNHSYAKGD